MSAVLTQQHLPPHDKVTEEGILSRIAKIDYYVLPDTTVTICSITMVNGFSIRGESACVDPRIFDAEKGKTYAKQRAMDALWQLEGYLLAENRYKWKGVVDAATEL